MSVLIHSSTFLQRNKVCVIHVSIDETWREDQETREERLPADTMLELKLEKCTEKRDLWPKRQETKNLDRKKQIFDSLNLHVKQEKE